MGSDAKWKAACKAWSADKLDQIEETMRLGEVMMFAATDRICELEDALDRALKALAVANTMSDALNLNGFPVSDTHWKNASGQMSAQYRALHLAAAAYREVRDVSRELKERVNV